jgi:hypothetical protein
LITVASVNEITLSETKHRRPRIDPAQPGYGDVRDAQRQFGLKESFLYGLIKEGVIEIVLIKGRGRTRGKRLINFDSIRRMLAELEAAEPERVPPPSLSQTRMKPRKDVVARLEAVLAELEGRLPLPAGAVGARLLDALEAAARIRRVVRTEAKTLLRKAPGALPGWSVSSANCNGKTRTVGELMPVRAHQRESALKLIRRRSEK